jgi:ferric-dicitrate binding protein FerR (iron transport regulator)
MGRARHPRPAAARHRNAVLAAALAAGLLAAPAAAHAMSWQATKQDIKTAAHETGHAIVAGAHAAGHAIRHGAYEVGRAFHRTFHGN